MNRLTTPELLDLLEARGTIATELLTRLRQLHAQAPEQFTVRVILKWLINRGAINPQDAERLLQLAGDTFVEGGRKAAAATGEALGLAPLAEDEPARPRPPVAQPVPPAPAAPLASSSTPVADDLFNDPAFQQAAGLKENPALAAAPAAAAARPKAKKNVWDSPLLLVGGGVLLLLGFAAVFLVWALNRETGDAALQLAEADYRAGSYAQAIHKFDEYLQRFPRHAGVSLARVHRGLARLRQAVDAAGDWSRALQTARDVLAEISTEEKFPEAHGELAALLPAIAEGLAREALENPQPRKVAEARETLELVNKYVYPPSLRPAQKLADIEASLAVAGRKLDRDASLAETIRAIEQAISQGRLDEGYQLRRKLVKTYPELRDSEGLQAAVAAIAQAQRQAVRWVGQKQAAATAAPDSPVAASLTFGRRLSGAAAAPPGDVACVLWDGVGYGLDAGTGEVLWRQFVGFDTQFVPQRVGAPQDGDALLVDSLRNELARVGRAGQIRWRAQLGEPFDAPPAVLRDKALVATRAGKLVSVALDTGQIAGHVLLPQPLGVAPAADAREKLYYQLGEHSNLFVLSAAEGTCREIFYLGHEPDRVRVPPVVVGRYVLVAENRFASGGVLHVLAADDEGLKLQRVQEIAYAGHVQTPPLAAGRSVFLWSDRGAMSTWEISAGGSGPPLRNVIDKPADETAEPVIPFPLLGGSRLWIAARGLSRYEVQTTRGRLAANWTFGGDDVFLQAPQQLASGALLAIRRRARLPGAVVSAVGADDGKPLWETELGAPTVVLDFAENSPQRLAALSLSGALYHLPDAAWQGHRANNSPAASIPAGSVLDAEGVRVGGQTWVFAAADLAATPAGQQLLEVSWPDKLSWKPLRESLSAPPAAWGERGLLLPCRVGQVLLDGGAVAPFQPRLESGADYTWSRPAILSASEFLIADGRTKLYRVGLAELPAPHLQAQAEATLASPIVSPLAVLGDAVYGVDAAGTLLGYLLPDLRPANDIPPSGRPAWGPQRVAGLVLLSTQQGELLALDDTGRLRWRSTLADGPLAGPPLAPGRDDENDVVLATTSGVIAVIDADTGRPRAKVDAGQPLLGSLRRHQDKLLATARDGTLLLLERPQ